MDDLKFNEIQYVLHDFSSVSLGEGNTFLKGYMRGDLAIHAHCILEPRFSSNNGFGYYCIVLERPNAECLLANHVEWSEVLAQPNIAYRYSEDVESAVLLDSIEFMQNPILHLSYLAEIRAGRRNHHHRRQWAILG